MLPQGDAPSVQLQLVAPPSALPKSLRRFRTCEGGTPFESLTALPVAADGTFSLPLAGACVITLTSSATRGAPIPDRESPPSRSFPTGYRDNFDGYAAEQTVRYLTDEAGSFAAAKSDVRHHPYRRQRLRS